MAEAKIIFKNLVLITGRESNCVSAVLPAAANHKPVLQYDSGGHVGSREILLNRHRISVKGLQPGHLIWAPRSDYYCPDETDTSFEWLANINDYWKVVHVLPEAFNLHAGLSAAYIHLANGRLETEEFVKVTTNGGEKVAKIYLDGDFRSARALAYTISWTTSLSNLGGYFVIRLEDCEGHTRDHHIPVGANNVATATIDNIPQDAPQHGAGLHFRQFETILNKKFDDFRPGLAGFCDDGVLPSVSRPENCWPGEC